MRKTNADMTMTITTEIVTIAEVVKIIMGGEVKDLGLNMLLQVTKEMVRIKTEIMGIGILVGVRENIANTRNKFIMPNLLSQMLMKSYHKSHHR